MIDDSDAHRHARRATVLFTVLALAGASAYVIGAAVAAPSLLLVVILAAMVSLTPTLIAAQGWPQVAADVRAGVPFWQRGNRPGAVGAAGGAGVFAGVAVSFHYDAPLLCTLTGALCCGAAAVAGVALMELAYERRISPADRDRSPGGTDSEPAAQAADRSDTGRAPADEAAGRSRPRPPARIYDQEADTPHTADAGERGQRPASRIPQTADAGRRPASTPASARRRGRKRKRNRARAGRRNR